MSIKQIMENELDKVDESEVAGFRIERSHSDNNLYSVFCVDKQGEKLVAIAVDLTAEHATDLVSVLNTPYESDPTLTELVEVEENGKKRFYYAAK